MHTRRVCVCGHAILMIRYRTTIKTLIKNAQHVLGNVNHLPKLHNKYFAAFPPFLSHFMSSAKTPTNQQMKGEESKPGNI